MLEKINQFWTCFLSLQQGIVKDIEKGNPRWKEKSFSTLNSTVTSLFPGLAILISHSSLPKPMVNLYFMPKGNPPLKIVVAEIIAIAPQLEAWQFHHGIIPFPHSVISLCFRRNFIDPETTIYQIYFSVHRFYKSSKKFHLCIYLQMNKSHPKAVLHEAMDNILLFYLGDDHYYRHISRYRIVRRRYASHDFLPLDELPNMIENKHQLKEMGYRKIET